MTCSCDTDEMLVNAHKDNFHLSERRPLRAGDRQRAAELHNSA